LAQGLAAAIVARGLVAWWGRLPLLSAAAALLLAFNLPSQGLQSYAAARTEALAERSKARGDRPPTPDEAVEDAAEALPACCALCGGLAWSFLVVSPVAAGATLAGARAARGNASGRDLFAGFTHGRYGSTLLASGITVLVGGGAMVLLVAVQSLAMAGPALRILGGLLPPAVLAAVALALFLLTLWLTARLWFALPRVTDPERPRAGGMGAVARSWQWTEGTAQWQLLALVTGLGMVTAGLALAADRVAKASAGAGIAASVAAAWLAITLWAAVLGAAYEQVADVREPRGPRGPEPGEPPAQGEEAMSA
jgi:hypothetical protein